MKLNLLDYAKSIPPEPKTRPARVALDQYAHPWLLIERLTGIWALGYDENETPCLRQVDDRGMFVTDYSHPTARRKLSIV